MNKKIKIIFFSIFIIMITFPIIQQNFKIVNINALKENRERIKKPEGNLLTKLFYERDFSKKYEEYYNDNYSMRDFFVKLNNQLMYSLFNESKQTIVGKDGWLCDRSVIENQEIAIDNLTDEQREKMNNRILKLSRYLKSKGITLILVPIPMKNTVYPEMFPNINVVRPKETGFLKFRNFLINNTELNYIDVYGILTKEKRRNPVYFKTDMHWNYVGAFHTSKEIVNLIGKLSKTNVKWSYPLQTYDKKFVGGGESVAMGLFWAPNEETAFVKNNWIDIASEVKNPPKPYGIIYRLKNDTGKLLLPKTLMIGNSFMLYLPSTGFYNYFSEVYHLHDLSQFDGLLEYIPKDTKYVIWEFFELELAYQLQQDQWWAQIEK